jgi:molecular chaperone IbpA
MGNKDMLPHVNTTTTAGSVTVNGPRGIYTSTSSFPTTTIWDTWIPQISNWTIGFDDQFKTLDHIKSTFTNQSYPPYNIRKVDEDKYEVEMAIAGFAKSEVDIEVKDQVLTIKGNKVKDVTAEYVHKGIANRDFTQTFALAEYVIVKGASLKDGILCVSLVRELPEEKKARTITIK